MVSHSLVADSNSLFNIKVSKSALRTTLNVPTSTLFSRSIIGEQKYCFILKNIQGDYFKSATIENSFVANFTKKFKWVPLPYFYPILKSEIRFMKIVPNFPIWRSLLNMLIKTDSSII